ncbi:MAG: hypothetical protein KJZ75_11260 [Hyphomonadaceae bacterium]|nr:hypothetical protein [Hyphomonadaceae bacterium]
MSDAIEKAGLIRSGKPPLHRRIGFLLSTNRNERNYKIGRYLESRKAGKGFGPKGKRRARVGNYSGVYATGVNKSEHVMSAIELLDDAIEKARAGAQRGSRARAYLAHRYRGGKGPGGQPRKAFYKSAELPMTDAVEELYEAVDKARGLIPRGGSSRLARRLAEQGAKARAKGGDPKASKRFSALGTLANRRKGRSIGLGYEPGKGYKSLRRTGKYK